jgi:hypothetical protein
MPKRRRLAESLFVIAPIRSELGRAMLRDMVDLYQQDTKVASRLGWEPEKCYCVAERRRKIDRVVACSLTAHET